MNNVTWVGVVVLVFSGGRAGGAETNNGCCIGNECFTVFPDPTNFLTAQTQCEDKGGHLMTVRSSVAHDVLSMLLGTLTGKFWIGLHLPSGCPDPAAASGLNGFQWVTKDSKSDYSNWRSDFDSGCSAPRCVSLSPEDEFKWTQAPCEEHVAGFLCEYSFSEPCMRFPAAPNETVFYVTPYGFSGEDVLSLPPGSTAIQRPSGKRHICFSESWLPAPWSCDINEGGCEYRCGVGPDKAPSCYCPPGKTVNTVNEVTCEVQVTDEPCLALRCDHFCYEVGGSYECACDHGFQLGDDGRSCLDVNDCADKRQCPGENLMCVNTVGRFECVCKPGYIMKEGECEDEDECTSAPCEHKCINTPGSYSCSCYDGFRVDPESPGKCELHCAAQECTAECDPNNRFHCYCPDGFLLEERPGGSVCIDINECDHSYCDEKCRNTFGSYLCLCSPGKRLLDGYKCVKIDDDDTDAGGEGSGMTTQPSVPTHPNIHSSPGPTLQPSSAVTVGGLVAIIVCTVLFLVVVVFLAHHMLSRRGKMESALKATEEEAHGLRQVTSDN
ncbi:thrombomodulin-like [Mugil cephalus]|uniref:thrombomodulin-like n=1 Tax=Mugil cephalus TaxID=48193 RepID=UPI001FB777C5|nr:thrombomodulin-like [Mugil cephalus]